MKWRYGYVLKEMGNRDFSGFESMCEEVKFLYGKAGVHEDLEEIIKEIRTFLNYFDPVCDLLLLSGPSVLCALALGVVWAEHYTLHVASFKEGTYEVFQCFERFENVESSGTLDLKRVS